MSVDALRAEQTNLTRRRIIEAVAEVATNAHPTAFSVPAVAAAAGVSVRTVYRYFPTKEDLLDGLAGFGGDAGVLLSTEGTTTMREYLGLLPELFANLYENRATVQAQNASPIGRDARQRRVDARRAKTRTALAAEVPDLPDDDLDRLTAACTALGSSVTLFELVDTLGLTVDDAADVVTWTMRTLIDEATRSRTTRTPPTSSHEPDTSNPARPATAPRRNRRTTTTKARGGT